MKYQPLTSDESTIILDDIRTWLQSGATISKLNPDLPVLIKQENGRILGNLHIKMPDSIDIMHIDFARDAEFKDNEIK